MSGVLLALALSAAPGPDTTAAALLAAAGQHVVVVVEETGDIRGRLRRLERSPTGAWSQVGPAVPVVVGRGGVGPKREGDGVSPEGVFSLDEAFGYGPDPPRGISVPFRAMAPTTVCVDDPASAHYNRVVDSTAVEPDWDSAEAMRRDRHHGDALYRLGVEVAYNARADAGAGSCIFLHVWRGPGSPTAGCTAMPADALETLMRWLEPSARPVLVQGRRGALEGLRQEGALPYPVPGAAPP